MSKFLELYNQSFESSSTTTPQWDTFYKVAVQYFKKILKPLATDVKISKGHFYLSGFFTAKSGQVYYFSIPDVRWSDRILLLRTAKSYKDYTRGMNMFIPIDENLPEGIAQKVH